MTQEGGCVSSTVGRMTTALLHGYTCWAGLLVVWIRNSVFPSFLGFDSGWNNTNTLEGEREDVFEVPIQTCLSHPFNGCHPFSVPLLFTFSFYIFLAGGSWESVSRVSHWLQKTGIWVTVSFIRTFVVVLINCLSRKAVWETSRTRCATSTTSCDLYLHHEMKICSKNGPPPIFMWQ
jgi:hypothetical protein